MTDILITALAAVTAAAGAHAVWTAVESVIHRSRHP